MRVLVVDDDPGLRRSLTLILGDAGHDVTSVDTGDEGLVTAEDADPDLILCDVRMPGISGLEFLERYREGGGSAPVLMMTAYGNVELAVDAMRRGATDFFSKPFSANEVLVRVEKAREAAELRREVGRLRSEVRSGQRFGEIVARSPAMMRALDVATKVARHPSSVLISGASGTGKELVARLIHRESDRADSPFIPVNCGAIPETLLESEFFGYVRGAFSGADRDKTGLFEAAHGGTLFLDEVGELPATLQVKLLRALQEREIRRLGGTETLQVDIRVLAASNRDLQEGVRDGTFREDLYYRLAVVTIHLPALRARSEEIPDLVHFFLERHRKRLGVKVSGIQPEAMEILLAYSWPGNIRELENVLERAMVLADRETLEPGDLPEYVRHPSPESGVLRLPDDDLSVKRHSAELERHLIQKALERAGGNRTQAADLLELSSRALRYKIKDYGLE